MQFLAIATIRIGEYGDMGFRLLGRKHHHFRCGDGLHKLDHTTALGRFSQVYWLTILDLKQVTLQQKLPIGAGIQLPATGQLDLIHTRHGTFGNGLNRQGRIDSLEAIANSLVGVGSNAHAADQPQGQRNNNAVKTHTNSWRKTV